MNRRSFLSRCLAGAVLGAARCLPMPAAVAVVVQKVAREPKTLLEWAQACGPDARLSELAVWMAKVRLPDIKWIEAPRDQPYRYEPRTSLPPGCEGLGEEWDE